MNCLTATYVEPYREEILAFSNVTNPERAVRKTVEFTCEIWPTVYHEFIYLINNNFYYLKTRTDGRLFFESTPCQHGTASAE